MTVDTTLKMKLIDFIFTPGLGRNHRSDQCEQRNGRFAMPDQCDGYIQCTNGVPEEKLCSDGLRFSENADPSLRNPCKYPAEIKCRNGARLQPADV